MEQFEVRYFKKADILRIAIKGKFDQIIEEGPEHTILGYTLSNRLNPISIIVDNFREEGYYVRNWCWFKDLRRLATLAADKLNARDQENEIYKHILTTLELANSG